MQTLDGIIEVLQGRPRPDRLLSPTGYPGDGRSIPHRFDRADGALGTATEAHASIHDAADRWLAADRHAQA